MHLHKYVVKNIDVFFLNRQILQIKDGYWAGFSCYHLYTLNFDILFSFVSVPLLFLLLVNSQ